MRCASSTDVCVCAWRLTRTHHRTLYHDVLPCAPPCTRTRAVIWEASTGSMLQEVSNAHTSWIHCAAFSPGGLRIATSGGDGGLHLWEPDSQVISAAKFKGTARQIGKSFRKMLGFV